jgi:hypothetical protein
MSLTFSSLFTYANHITLAAMASYTLRYAIALCFFFKTREGTDVFISTEILSPIINVGHCSSTPNDLSMNLISTLSSVAILAATNSES